MVHARFHMICGNCGDDKSLSYRIERDFHFENEGEENEKALDECVVSCSNCGTLHFLSSYIPLKQEAK